MAPPMPLGLTTEQLVLIFFHEIPNKAAAAAALALFAVISLVITALSFKTRSYYMLTVAVTGFLEMAGYAMRIHMLSHPTLNGLIILQALLIISPVLLAIVEYITVSKLLALSTAGGKASRLSRTVSWLFTISDILCLTLQGAGGGMYANPGRMEMARKLLLAGLGAQLGFFAIFTCIAVHMQTDEKFGYRGDKLFRGVFVCLYATIALQFVRNVFRVIEFCYGYSGELATHELYLYIFDFAPIYACFLFFAFMHYGFWLGPNAAARQSRLSAKSAAKQAVDKQGPVAAELPVLHVHAC
uniref:THH1/TOM1/TOM3 domain-containing protein n=1 Tax=Tetradesmus obliquus TaxID=3088 RepID=A0A383WPD6_TETOB|eukprot:jgi/Sobl393_1/1616/SZX78576.1